MSNQKIFLCICPVNQPCGALARKAKHRNTSKELPPKNQRRVIWSKLVLCRIFGYFSEKFIVITVTDNEIILQSLCLMVKEPALMKNEKIDRRTFVGAVLLAAFTIPTTAAIEGAKIGVLVLRGSNKEGALGECSYGATCGGSGGKCGWSSVCAGGSDGVNDTGKCSYGYACGGGGGRCSYSATCSGGGGYCSHGNSCGGNGDGGGGSRCGHSAECAGS